MVTEAVVGREMPEPLIISSLMVRFGKEDTSAWKGLTRCSRRPAAAPDAGASHHRVAAGQDKRKHA
jgi:hypothetical protein